MVIAYVSRSLIPSRYANSVQVMNMCEALGKAGHDTTLFALSGEPEQRHTRHNQPCEPERQYTPNQRAGNPEQTSDRRKPLSDHEIYGVEPVFRIRKTGSLIQRGVPNWRHFFMIRHMKPRPDLIYGRDPRLLFLLADSGVPIILELHDPPRRLDLLIVKLLLRKKNLHRLIVISGGLLGHLKRLYPSIAMSRVTVLPNGARKTEPAFRNSTPPELYGGRERFHIGYAGHLYPGKGMETISALAEVLTDLEFHVVGGMPEDIEYWTNRSRNNIHLYGHINHGDIHAYLTRFDIVVAPFQERVSVHRGKMDISSYTSPLKLFEYMATGKPIIAADLPVLREILQHEVNCLLVPPGDLGAWVRAVEKLRYDKALRETLGRRARSDFEQLFTLDERVRRALDGIPGCSRS